MAISSIYKVPYSAISLLFEPFNCFLHILPSSIFIILFLWSNYLRLWDVLSNHPFNFCTYVYIYIYMFLEPRQLPLYIIRTSFHEKENVGQDIQYMRYLDQQLYMKNVCITWINIYNAYAIWVSMCRMPCNGLLLDVIYIICIEWRGVHCHTYTRNTSMSFICISSLVIPSKNLLDWTISKR